MPPTFTSMCFACNQVSMSFLGAASTALHQKLVTKKPCRLQQHSHEPAAHQQAASQAPAGYEPTWLRARARASRARTPSGALIACCLARRLLMAATGQHIRTIAHSQTKVMIQAPACARNTRTLCMPNDGTRMLRTTAPTLTAARARRHAAGVGPAASRARCCSRSDPAGTGLPAPRTGPRRAAAWPVRG